MRTAHCVSSTIPRGRQLLLSLKVKNLSKFNREAYKLFRESSHVLVFLLFGSLFLCWHYSLLNDFPSLHRNIFPTTLPTSLSAASLISDIAVYDICCQHKSCISDELSTGNHVIGYRMIGSSDHLKRTSFQSRIHADLHG